MSIKWNSNIMEMINYFNFFTNMQNSIDQSLKIKETARFWNLCEWSLWEIGMLILVWKQCYFSENVSKISV